MEMWDEDYFNEEVPAYIQIDYDESILVNVKRISDKKKFALPLADLKAVDEDSNNFQLIDDFSMWFWSYRWYLTAEF